MLEGQCKEDFNEWLVVGGGRTVFERYYDDDGIFDTYKWFCKHTDSMQWGVIQDFADSVKIEIKVFVNHNSGKYVSFASKSNKPSEHKSRAEARTAAIKQFSKLYNAQG